MPRYSRRYSGDPKWINAKFASKGTCGHNIARGDRAFYYPSSRSIYCASCGEAKAAQFEAERFDEDFAPSPW